MANHMPASGRTSSRPQGAAATAGGDAADENAASGGSGGGVTGEGCLNFGHNGEQGEEE